MDIVYFSGMLLSLFYSILILSKNKKILADYVLAIWMIVFAINLLIPFLISRTPELTSKLGGLDGGLFTLHATLLYFYTKLLIDDRQVLRFKDVKHLLPFLSVYLCILPFYMLDEDSKLDILSLQNETPFMIYGCMLLNLLYFMFYNVLTLKKLYKHKKNILEIFSFTENQDINWITILVIGTLAIALAFVITVYLMFHFHANLTLIDFVIYFFYLGYIVVIGHWGFRQGRIYHFVDENLSDFYKKRLAEKSTGTKAKQQITAEDRALVEKLTAYMEQEKPYLYNDLCLNDLAHALGLSIFKISFLLNNVMDSNFYDLVNKYRVNEFKQRILNGNSKYTLLAVALECGFNSKATFNRIFKHQTGLTPSEYKDKISS